MILYESKDDKIISIEDGFKHIINPDSDNEQIALYKNSEMFNNKESWSEEKYSCFLLAAFAKVIIPYAFERNGILVKEGIQTNE